MRSYVASCGIGAIRQTAFIAVLDEPIKDRHDGSVVRPGTLLSEQANSPEESHEC
jgi:hypothetical protein